MSVPSIDPKTVAIGAAVVVAGVGAYMIFSSPSLKAGEEKAGLGLGVGVGGVAVAGAVDDGLMGVTGQDAHNRDLIAHSVVERKRLYQEALDAIKANNFVVAILDTHMIAYHNDGVQRLIDAKFVGTPYTDPLAGNKFVQDLTSQIDAASKAQADKQIAAGQAFLAQGNLDLALTQAQQARDTIDVVAPFFNGGGQAVTDNPALENLLSAITAATYKRDSQAIAKAAQPGGTAKAKLDAGLQAASDGGKLMSASGGDANNDKYRQQYGSAALKSQSGAVIQQAADDEEQAYRTLILRGLNLPADQYIALAEPYIIKWGQATYDEKVGNRYTQYYGPYHTYQDKKNSTNPHDLDDAMTALNQLPDWLVGSAERTSFSERRGQAALTAAHISQEDAEKQLSAIFGNLGSVASKLGTVFVKK